MNQFRRGFPKTIQLIMRTDIDHSESNRYAGGAASVINKTNHNLIAPTHFSNNFKITAAGRLQTAAGWLSNYYFSILAKAACSHLFYETIPHYGLCDG